MALTMMAMAGIAGSIVLMEGLAALVEHMVGDPEADVELALRALAAKNQRRAMHEMGAGARHEDMMAEHYGNPMAANFQRGLTSAAINAGGGGFVQQSQGELLQSVESRLGVPPGHLARMSSPQRMGDMSSVFHATGRTPPSEGSLPQQQGHRIQAASQAAQAGGQPQAGGPQ